MEDPEYKTDDVKRRKTATATRTQIRANPDLDPEAYAKDKLKAKQLSEDVEY
jgi:hypothetical protein